MKAIYLDKEEIAQILLEHYKNARFDVDCVEIYHNAYIDVVGKVTVKEAV
jgi:hypothetical protein